MAAEETFNYRLLEIWDSSSSYKIFVLCQQYGFFDKKRIGKEMHKYKILRHFPFKQFKICCEN